MINRYLAFSKVVLCLWLVSFASLTWANVPCMMQKMGIMQVQAESAAPHVVLLKTTPRCHKIADTQNSTQTVKDAKINTCPHCEFSAFFSINPAMLNSPYSFIVSHTSEKIASTQFSFASFIVQLIAEPPRTV